MARSFGASLLRRYGFRRVLLVNGTLTALIIVGCPALTPSTPYTVIAIVLFASGLTRSLRFSALNSLAFADVPSEQTSAANTLANVVQQLTLGFGVAAAAAAVHLAALLSHDAATGPTLTDFRYGSRDHGGGFDPGCPGPFARRRVARQRPSTLEERRRDSELL
jgi:hypothetical protein